jgi:hypothetical protein
MRNGQAVIKPVYSAKGVALYTTKEAADGEVVLSDATTLTRFKALATDVVVPLVREDE